MIVLIINKQVVQYFFGYLFKIHLKHSFLLCKRMGEAPPNEVR
ncbi:hypothetical protein B4153_3816 [Bacillus cereus]|uniref:Uncharacterized protein n=1 Tax=Bacillus cereus (strain AH187) TaxID=405534 RepID=B7HKM8_BACC7|nr:hypothetical protein BCAH187_A3723 [Bacillus cereus AH187]EEK99153.1 hypothetical protein bcere0013_34150 [Bacillus cereus BDRD-ST26]KKZ94654.1 hypothetical protein B4153_3816 [Bacillus cereus]